MTQVIGGVVRPVITPVLFATIRNAVATGVSSTDLISPYSHSSSLMNVYPLTDIKYL